MKANQTPSSRFEVQRSTLNVRGPVLSTILASALLLLALAAAGAAESKSAPIPLSEIGARATADYQGEALAVAETAEGARLRCRFQKLEGRATAEGLTALT